MSSPRPRVNPAQAVVNNIARPIQSQWLTVAFRMTQGSVKRGPHSLEGAYGELVSDEKSHNVDLPAALDYFQRLLQHYQAKNKLNKRVNIEIIPANMVYYACDLFSNNNHDPILLGRYVFNDLTVCRRFLEALQQFQNNPDMELGRAMLNMGLNPNDGQPLPVANGPAVSAAPANNAAPVVAAAPVNAQTNAPKKKKSTFGEFLARHKWDIIFSVLTGGLYLLVIAARELIKFSGQSTFALKAYGKFAERATAGTSTADISRSAEIVLDSNAKKKADSAAKAQAQGQKVELQSKKSPVKTKQQDANTASSEETRRPSCR